MRRWTAQRNWPSGEAGLALSWPDARKRLEFFPVDQNLIQIVVLAFVAGFVLFRLYVTLGRRTGSERPAQPAPAAAGEEFPQEANAPSPRPAPLAAGATGDGLMAIVRADPNFDVEHFVVGARAAYEMIVKAFAKSDREALRGLLTPKVYESYAASITQRETTGAAGPELVRVKSAELTDASLQGDIARVVVKFEAELAEGAHGIRDARERWTFERSIRSADPNWLLSRVQAA